MKKLSRYLFTNTLMGLLVLPLITSAGPVAENNALTQVPVSIGNNSQVPLYNARLKLTKTGSWVSIGDIKPGQNIFVVQGHMDDEPNLIEAQLENGQ